MVQESYTKGQLDEIFDRETPISGEPEGEWRKDACGNKIARSEYRNVKSTHGWEVGHIYTNSGNVMINSRPFKISENRSKRDKILGEHGC